MIMPPERWNWLKTCFATQSRMPALYFRGLVPGFIHIKCQRLLSERFPNQHFASSCAGFQLNVPQACQDIEKTSRK
jgi:hypothetical protein